MRDFLLLVLKYRLMKENLTLSITSDALSQAQAELLDFSDSCVRYDEQDSVESKPEVLKKNLETGLMKIPKN
ncbi:MAG: hypothetical protein ACI977_000362 [Candidatus Nanohaloarchaea archaeon]|jgi:hypothetical protein